MDLTTKLRSLSDELAAVLMQEIVDVGVANDANAIGAWMSEHLEDRIDDCCISEQVGDLISTLDGMPCVDDLSVRLDDLEVEQAGTQKDLDKHLLEMPDLTLLADRVRLLELSVVPIVEHLANLMRDLTNLGLVHDSTQDDEITEATTRAQVTSEIPAEALDQVALELH